MLKWHNGNNKIIKTSGKKPQGKINENNNCVQSSCQSNQIELTESTWPLHKPLVHILDSQAF